MKSNRKRRSPRRHVWNPERQWFRLPHIWHSALDGSRPVVGHHILAVDAHGKGHIVKSQDFRNPDTIGKAPHYGYSKRVIQAQREAWQRMCNELLIVWWSYMPDVPPIRFDMPSKRTLYYGNQMPAHTQWVNHTEQTHEKAYFCTACKQWFAEIPQTHQCGKVKNAGPLCITSTPYA